MGKGGGHLPPGNVEKCVLLQMLSETSVYEVFMHHFEKMSASGGFVPRSPPGSCPWTLLGDCRSSPLEKIPRAPMTLLTAVTNALVFWAYTPISASPYPQVILSPWS